MVAVQGLARTTVAAASRRTMSGASAASRMETLPEAGRRPAVLVVVARAVRASPAPRDSMARGAWGVVSWRLGSASPSSQWRGSRCSSSGTSGTQQQQQEQTSDERHQETGEYDTQDKYKRVGNPIQWANPTGGAPVEDQSSNYWRWIFPAGTVVILLLCLNSRRKAMNKENDEKVISSMNIAAPDTRRFSMPAFMPSSGVSGDSDEDMPPPSEALRSGFDFTPSSSSSYTSPPPSAESRW